MKTIKILNNLVLSDSGVQGKMKFGRLQKVHLQQGDLDGACAVYSAIMILILIGAAKYEDICNDSENCDKRFRIEKLKKELLDTKGMHRKGNHFYHEKDDNLKHMLERSFSKLINVQHHDNKSNVVEVIKEQIEDN